MEELISLVARWKEFGWVGILIILVGYLFRRFFDWLLDALGVSIKRGYSREDDMDAKFKDLDKKYDALDRKVTRLEQVYEIVHKVAHDAADGIEKEVVQNNAMTPAIEFFLKQLRAIQGLDEVLRPLEPRSENGG